MTACTPRHCHKRLLLLLVSILLSSGFLFSICFAVAQHSGWVTFTLVAPECLLLALRATHTIARYLLHLKSLDKPATTQLTSQGKSPDITTAQEYLRGVQNPDLRRLEPSPLLRRNVRGDLLPDRWPGPSRAHAAARQHAPVDGLTSDLHAAARPLRPAHGPAQTPQKLQKDRLLNQLQLPNCACRMWAQLFVRRLQVCHLLGRHGPGSETGMRP